MCSKIISDGVSINYIPKDYKYYLNKSTILFGASGSGKSTILIEILYLLRKKVPNIFVFCPTSESNNAFDGIVPDILIYNDVEIETLNRIYKRQQAATKLYNHVNNMKELYKLFIKINDTECMNMARKVHMNSERIIKKKNSKTNINIVEKKQSENEIKKLRDEYLFKLYKKTIKKHKSKLSKMKLSVKESYIVKYVDFNPNCVIVLDDCGAILKRFQKEEVIKKIIFQGRHNYINIILTLQDDLNLDTSIKKNAFVNIFTTSRCASAYFQRSSNNFPKKEQKKINKIIDTIFFSNTKKNYKKLVYIRDDPDPYRYTVATIYDKFRFGSSSLWKINNKLINKNKECDITNDPLMKSFRLDLNI
jgi:ABC-type dipeptide/oligopeptide/nickel transport system ATPase subunit